MQQSSICLYLFFLLEVIVHQHIITLDDVKTFFINRKAGQLLTGQPGTQNDERFNSRRSISPCRLSRRMYSVTILSTTSCNSSESAIGSRRCTIPEVPLKQHSAARYFFLVLVKCRKKFSLKKKSKDTCPIHSWTPCGEDYSQRWFHPAPSLFPHGLLSMSVCLPGPI